jgi:hypothetical protein
MLENKVANSGLKVLDLEDFFPKESVVELDISVFLWNGFVLKEKEFRADLKGYYWENYKGKIVALFCSTDAIVPQWAYMLLVMYLEPIATDIFFGNKTAVEEKAWLKAINGINIDSFREERIIIKGCGKLEQSGSAFVEISKLLKPVVKSLMFGEPCSTVPVYKKKE